ncbi:MAG TPA: hypothetical protein VM118_06735 [Acidobacteriota bacterium]|nr:hypothetical protein [Acidobacteriota bacterium]
MMIDGKLGSPEQPGGMKPQRPADRARAQGSADRDPAESAPSRDATSPVDAPGVAKADLHRTEALREAAARLLDEGGIDASLDGETRPSRIDVARQKFEAGAFDRREVLTRIVDRLIEQWRL